MKEYDGPLNPTGLVNPYVFLLYKQNGSIPTTNNTKDDLVNNTFQTLGRYGGMLYLCTHYKYSATKFT